MFKKKSNILSYLYIINNFFFLKRINIYLYAMLLIIN